MELKVRKIGNGYGVLFPKHLMEELRVEEGSTLNVEKIDGAYRIFPYDAEFAAALESFRDTEPKHRNTYRELAK